MSYSVTKRRLLGRRHMVIRKVSTTPETFTCPHDGHDLTSQVLKLLGAEPQAIDGRPRRNPVKDTPFVVVIDCPGGCSQDGVTHPAQVARGRYTEHDDEA